MRVLEAWPGLPPDLQFEEGKTNEQDLNFAYLLFSRWKGQAAAKIDKDNNLYEGVITHVDELSHPDGITIQQTDSEGNKSTVTGNPYNIRLVVPRSLVIGF